MVVALFGLFAGKTPMAGRICAVLLAALPAAVSAQVWTEADVVRLAQSRGLHVAQTAAAVARAEASAVVTAPNPELSWQRAHLPAGTVREDTLSLAWPLGGGAARAAQVARAHSEAAEARATGQWAQAAAVTDALTLFYAALHADARAQVARHHADRLRHAVRVLAMRQGQGTVAGAERARLEVELALAESLQACETSDGDAARRELAVRLGGGDGVQIQGSLAPTPTDAASLPSLPDADPRAADAARAAVQHAARAGWPTWQATAGVRLDAPGEVGYVVGVAANLPVFGRGQAERAASVAQLQAVAAAEVTRRSTRQTHAARAFSQKQAATAELARLEQASAAPLAKVVAAAESGYREGTRSLVDLLDAERALADVARRQLELQWRIRQADITLRAATGAFE
jgi:outer membrane protein TolC